MSGSRFHWLIVGALSVMLCGSASAQVSGGISRVGLAGGGAQLVREGNWTFVEVMLAYQGSAPFAGVLEVAQPDRDGDIARSRTNIALSPDAAARPYAVYFVPAAQNLSGGVAVRLYDDRGQVVPIIDSNGTPRNELVSDAVIPINQEVGLILDLSEPPIPLLGFKPPDTSGNPARSPQDARWEVRPLDPRSLPDRWIGLELADVIVWDDPDPSVLAPAQIDALVDWVRSGGRLIVAAARNWQNLNQSRLADILPVQITGERRADEIQEFTQKILRDPDHDLDAYFAARPVTRCVMKPLAGGVSVPADAAKLEGLDPLVWRGVVGHGSVTFVGASLRDLLASVPLPKAESRRPEKPDEPDPQLEVIARARSQRDLVFQRILGVPTYRAGDFDSFQTVRLYDSVRNTIGFQRMGAVYLMSALVFALAYTVTAGWGSYWWLKRRNMLQHAWTVFTLLAIVGTAVGATAVATLRGVTTRLEQLTVVDGQANSPLAFANALFGVKTPSHMRLNVRLPAGTTDAEPDYDGLGPIRVLPADDSGMLGGSDVFVAPQSYLCGSASQSIDELPVRATLKELEGYWDGALDGRLEAQLRMAAEGAAGAGRSAVVRFARGTSIRNRLGVDLRHCYLLETDQDAAVQDIFVRCYHLGDIPATGAGSELDENSPVLRANFFEKTDPKKADSEEKPRKIPTLADRIKEWCAPFVSGAFGQPQIDDLGVDGRDANAERALLLLSTFSLYNPKDAHAAAQASLLRSHGRRLECTYLLNRYQAVLIGFSSGPPPADLNVDRKTLAPNHGLTMYRFVVPIERDEIVPRSAP